MLLTPQLPLMWTSSWLAIITAWRGLGKQVGGGIEVQESALMILAVILVANIYNLTILYRQPAINRQQAKYGVWVLAYALVLIFSTILAWGRPQDVALPSSLNIWTGLFVLLNVCQAALGIYFALQCRPQMVAGDDTLLSLWLMPVYLVVLDFLLPPFLLLTGGLRYLTLAGGGIAVVALIFYQWRQLARIFASTAAVQSACYQGLIGADLAGSMLAFFFAFDTVVLRGAGGRLDLISYCLAVCLLVVALSTGLLAAMQRYHLKYQYGAARKHKMRFLYGGAVTLVLFLMVTCFWIG